MHALQGRDAEAAAAAEEKPAHREPAHCLRSEVDTRRIHKLSPRDNGVGFVRRASHGILTQRLLFKESRKKGFTPCRTSTIRESLMNKALPSHVNGASRRGKHSWVSHHHPHAESASEASGAFVRRGASF